MPYLGRTEHRQTITPQILERLMCNPHQLIRSTSNERTRHTPPHGLMRWDNQELEKHRYPVGSYVMFRTSPTSAWYPAQILRQLEEPKSYLIKNNYAVLFRRNEKHLCPYMPWCNSNPSNRTPQNHSHSKMKTTPLNSP